MLISVGLIFDWYTFLFTYILYGGQHIEDKENMGCAEDNLNEVVTWDVTDQMNDDGKENAINPEDSNRYDVSQSYNVLFMC